MQTKFKTLHEAIIDVLKRKGKASFHDIAKCIAKESLWKRKSDGYYPELFQIRLRTIVHKRYKDLFVEEEEGVISLTKK